MSDAARDTYRNVVEPELNYRQQQVLKTIEMLNNTYKKAVTMFDVAKAMGINNNAHAISGRFGELEKAGKIEKVLNEKTNKPIRIKRRYNLHSCNDEGSSFSLYKVVKENNELTLFN